MTGDFSTPAPEPDGVPEAERSLVRAIGRWTSVALMVNAIVGAGIFGLPARVHALSGPYGLLAYLACALAVAAFVLCFAEVASRFTATGGPYLYTLEAFGPLAGFLIGWLTAIARAASIAATAQVATGYAGYLWPALATPAGHAAGLVFVIGGLTLVNVAGVRQAAGAGALFAIAKLAPLLVFVGVGLFHVQARAFAGASPPGAGPFAQTMLLLVFAFGGFEAMVITAGESRDPRRDLPFALIVSLAIVTVLYVLVQLVCIGTLPGLAGSARPLADASARFLGPGGASLIALGAVVSATGTSFASLIVGPRVLLAMAARRQLPRVLAAIHGRFRTPHVAILAMSGVGLVLALTGTFASAATLSVTARLLSYASTAGALIVLRRRSRGAPAPFPVPGGIVVATLAIVASVALIALASGRDRRDLAIALAAGAALHGLAVYGARRSRAA